MIKWFKKLYKAVMKIFRKDKVDIDRYTQFITQLNEAFYGTLVERGSKASTYRKRHKEDGWRHGKSHPFKWKGKKYDKGKNIDKSVDLYNKLSDEIGDKYGYLQ